MTDNIDVDTDDSNREKHGIIGGITTVEEVREKLGMSGSEEPDERGDDE